MDFGCGIQVISQEKTVILDPIRAGLAGIISGVSSRKDVPILDETPLSALGLDSLDLLELVIQCEGHFAISIPDQEIARFRNVKDVLTAVVRRSDSKRRDDDL